MFVTNETLIESARAILWERRHLLWLIGGSGTGKTTLSRAAAALAGTGLYDMDEAFFGRYTIDPQRHPATTAWFSAEDPLGWILARPWPEFEAIYRAANAETLDLLAADLAGQPDAPLIIDGGITHPSVLAGAVPAERVICLEREETARAREWATAASRAEMKAAVLALPDGPRMWLRFLEYDRRLAATIDRESRACGIRLLAGDETTGMDQLAVVVARYFDQNSARPV